MLVRTCIHFFLPEHILTYPALLRSQYAFVSFRKITPPSQTSPSLLTVLKRIYGPEKITTNYSNTISSVAFAGTVVGMLVFGYLSDKLGRKFGMVRTASIAPDCGRSLTCA